MPFLYYSSPFRSSSAVTEKTSHSFRNAVTLGSVRPCSQLA